jgi:hypothetical protein
MKWLSRRSMLCASYKVHLVKQCASFFKINVTRHCTTWVCPEMYLTVYYCKLLTWRKMYFTQYCNTRLCCEIHREKVLWKYISDYSKEWTFCKITAVFTAKGEHALKLHQWIPHRMNVLEITLVIAAKCEGAVKLLQWLPHRMNVLWSYISDYRVGWTCCEITSVVI